MSDMHPSEDTKRLPLRRHGGGGLAALGVLVGNGLVVAGLALADQGGRALGVPLALRVALVLAVGVALTAALVAFFRSAQRETAAQLVLEPDVLRLAPRFRRERRAAFGALRARRVAYLPREGGVGFPHVAALELSAPGFGHLTLCAPAIRGGWPRADTETYVPPTYVLSLEDWDALCARLGSAGLLASQTPSGARLDPAPDVGA